MVSLRSPFTATRVCDVSSTMVADSSFSLQGVVVRAFRTSFMYWFGWPKILRWMSIFSEWRRCGGRIM